MFSFSDKSFVVMATASAGLFSILNTIALHGCSRVMTLHPNILKQHKNGETGNQPLLEGPGRVLEGPGKVLEGSQKGPDGFWKGLGEVLKIPRKGKDPGIYLESSCKGPQGSCKGPRMFLKGS